jgi:hypothetical protein
MGIFLTDAVTSGQLVRGTAATPFLMMGMAGH